ncbi:MAG TPA: hypothetical protein VGR89_14160, partial [Puia sp.]|nr:hypothetical protein [Puia sp.]
MKRTCRIKYWLVAALMAGGSSCSAQYHPIVTAKVDSVTRAGIFRIVLPPSFVACCRPDLSDIRIIDGNGRQAPYVLRTDPGDKWNAGYTTIPDPHIVEHDSNDRHSYYLLQYNDSYRIERLSLVIRHPALYKRTAEILTAPGPDQQHVATITIDPADSVFSFQPVKAARLLIDVANEDNAPLAISRVATFQSGICLLAYL